MVACASTENVVVDTNYQPVLAFETSQLLTVKKDIQTAFSQADTKKIESMISPKFLATYKTGIESNTSKLTDFGNLLKTMKLLAGDSIGAVYQVDYQGKKFEITFSKDEDGLWKLINF